jgi:hypothetical protein
VGDATAAGTCLHVKKSVRIIQRISKRAQKSKTINENVTEYYRMAPDNQIPMHKPKIKQKNTVFFVFGVSFLILMAFFYLGATKTIYEETGVSYNETITSTEQEPYTERVAVSPTRFFLDGISTGMQGEGCADGCECDTYHYSGYTKICTYCICPTFRVTPVAEYQTVTKYREILKTRIETRTKTEKRPVEVNWIFGFRTPYAFHLPFTG